MSVTVAALRETTNSIDTESWLQTLHHQLSVAPRARRVETLIREILNRYQQIDPGHQTVVDAQILRHLAVMALPVEASVLSYCPEIRRQWVTVHHNQVGGDVEKALERLVRRRPSIPAFGQAGKSFCLPIRYSWGYA